MGRVLGAILYKSFRNAELSSFKFNKNIFGSLVAQILPAVVALVTMPYLLKVYGVERLGILTFVWTLLNYSLLLDLGLSRTLTKLIAFDDSNLKISGGAFRIGLFMILITGLLGIILFSTTSDWVVKNYLNLSPSLILEAKNSILALGGTLPALLLFSYFKGGIEGRQDFALANNLQGLGGVVTFLVPSATAIFSNRIDLAIFWLAIVRWIFVILSILGFIRKVGISWWSTHITTQSIKYLFKEGFWISALAILNPIFVYTDKLVVAALIPTSELAYYTTPFEAILRMTIIPLAVTRIVFPIFSKDGGLWTESTKNTFFKSNLWIAFMIIPAGIILFIFMKPLLSLWLSSDFGIKSLWVSRLALVGILFNSLTWVALSYLQTTKWIKWTVIVPTITFLLSFLVMYPLVKIYFIEGAAIAFSLRLILDFFIFNFLVMKYRRRNLET